MDLSLDEERVKELFKQAMVELLEERQDLFHDLFADVIEDIALANAIREAEAGPRVEETDIRPC